MKILANFQLCYMDIMSYFLYFSVFFKNKNGGKGGNSVPVEML